MMNMMQIMQQAQKMQKKFKETQGELENIEVISTSGNGAVTAVLNGQGKFKSIKLTPEAINPSNPASVDADTIEMLEDLLTEALSDATNKATNQMEAKMKSITGGISIPGLF
ncbi:MAG: YbaB/EbfC family nucleoid-associated protein [Candidatus Gastranaerophilales bacterium]|nr:YbaB/EbfC family nucleoid-associated protein [Candidatus Gastranaerophilales bacterium]